MGILDEAIREHLDLKRHHGAEESELEGLEAEAFGPADRPDATSPEAGVKPGTGGEAETQVISPGSSLTTPAGEGDQLDKVFDAGSEEGPGQEDAATPEGGKPESAEAEKGTESGEATDEPGRPGKATEVDEPTVAEHEIPPVAGPPEPGSESPSAPIEAAPAEPRPGPDDRGDDAGDALEREREHLASHPTEHYDVDAAIAEENEIDVLSESSLSDELDRALDGPDALESDDLDSESAASSTPAPQVEAEPGEPGSGPEPDFGPGFESAPTGGSDEEVEDVLEDTPDFLEETPEHDRLWFEQKEPKDFDFGD